MPLSDTAIRKAKPEAKPLKLRDGAGLSPAAEVAAELSAASRWDAFYLARQERKDEEAELSMNCPEVEDFGFCVWDPLARDMAKAYVEAERRDSAMAAHVAQFRVAARDQRKASGRRRFDFLKLANSYSRLPMLLDRFTHHRSVTRWFRELGKVWSSCDNVGWFLPELRPLFAAATEAELAAMMDRQERAALAKLPELFPVYRGAYPCNAAGLSWSLDRATAARFPTLNRYTRPGEQALLLTATVARPQAVLKLDREESEIITAAASVTAEERLPPTPHD